MSILDRLKQPEQESKINLPNATAEINHRLRVVFLHVENPYVSDTDFSELEKHLRKRGYFLVVFSPVAGPPISERDRRIR